MKKDSHIIWACLLSLIIVLIFLGFGFRAANSTNNQTNHDVCIALLGTEGCDTCQEIKEYFLPQLTGQYPQIKVHYFDLDDLENYRMLLFLEKKYQRETDASPILVIGDHLLAGKEEIEQQLEKYIRFYVQKGGCSLPDLPNRQETEVASSMKASSSPIYMALFIKPGCLECDRTYSDIKYLNKIYPQLHIKQFDVSQSQNILAQEIMAEKIGIPENEALHAPMVIVGEDSLAMEKLTYNNLESLIQKYQASGSNCIWADIAIDHKSSSEAYQKIADQFQKLGPLAILGSGLLDGINPCAFATIIFLISWLALIGKKGKDLLWVGGSFTLAVFLTYLLLGLGMFQFLKKLSMLNTLHVAIFLAMALGTFIFGILSIRDYFKIRAGKTREVALQLPKVLKKRIHRVIKEKTNVKGAVIAAFAMGVTISLLELACTGQVYLPTIMVVMGIPKLKLHAISYLVLYNLAFILPLVAVFLVTYGGSSSKQLAEVMERHLATTKLLTGVFFFLITAVLIAALMMRL